MKRLLKLFLVFTFLMVGICNTSQAFCGNKYRIVLFYADWNVYSSKAISTMQKVSDISGGKFVLKKINIDDQASSFDIQHLGLRPKYSIPCYYIIDKNDRILYETKFYDEAPEDILKEIKNVLDN